MEINNLTKEGLRDLFIEARTLLNKQKKEWTYNTYLYAGDLEKEQDLIAEIMKCKHLPQVVDTLLLAKSRLPYCDEFLYLFNITPHNLLNNIDRVRKNIGLRNDGKKSIPYEKGKHKFFSFAAIPNSYEHLKEILLESNKAPEIVVNEDLIVAADKCIIYGIKNGTKLSEIAKILSSECETVPTLQHVLKRFENKRTVYGMPILSDSKTLVLSEIISDFGKYRKALNYLFLYYEKEKGFLKEMFCPTQFFEYYSILENQADAFMKKIV